MPPSMDAIRLDVKRALYTSEDDITFLAFSNDLVTNGTLSSEQYNQHHKEIAQLFEEWRTEVQAKASEHNQQLPMSLPTPESLPPQTEPSKTLPSSSPEDARTAVETLREAVAAIIKDRELLDAPTGWLYLPNGMNHATAPVAVVQSSCSQSYIRAKTLDRNEIEWKGSTVVLRWKCMALIGNGDQSVQRTCFNVVEEADASQVGFGFDMLVGVDHSLPLQNRTRSPGPEEVGSTNPFVIDRTYDLPAHSYQDSRSAEPHPVPADLVSITGSGHGLAIFIKELEAGRDGASGAVEYSSGRSTELHNASSSKRKLSYSDNSDVPSKKNRSFGGRVRR